MDLVNLDDWKTEKETPGHRARLDQDRSLVELWVLAEKLIIPQLQNHVVEAIENRCKWSSLISIPSLHYVYSNTSKGSPLPRLFVDQCTYLTVGEFAERPNEFPKERLIGLLTAMSKGFPAGTKKKLLPRQDMSRYKVEEN